MIAQGKFLKNWKAVEEAEEMGVEPPEKVFEFDEVLINPDYVEAVNKDVNGDLVLNMKYFLHNWTIKYDEEIWDYFKSRFQ